MTDIGDSDYEYDGGNGSGDHDTPDCPHKATAGVSDTEESYGDAAFDDDGAGGVEELGDEEELLAIGQFRCARLSIEEGENTHLDSLHYITGLQGGSKLAGSVEAADNT